jgi:hypothetical protein
VYLTDMPRHGNRKGWTFDTFMVLLEERQARARERHDALNAKMEARALADATALDLAVKSTKTALEETAAGNAKEFDEVRDRIEKLTATIADGLTTLNKAMDARETSASAVEKHWSRVNKIVGGGAGALALAAAIYGAAQLFN